ncbi:beta-lactamase family protein [bacterium]|nr:beta-lactamase family protein [bacterium]
MKLFKRILLALLLIIGIAAIYNYPKLNIIAGYAGKNAASNNFIAKRTLADIAANDNDMPLINLTEVTSNGNQIDASVFGLLERKTICREGLGCVLVNDKYDLNTILPVPERITAADSLPFPYGNVGRKDSIFDTINYDKLKKAVEDAFSNNEVVKSRTVMVIYKDHIVAEKYLNGFNAETPILGWSMTKSVLATLYGILEYQGKLKVVEPAPVEAWKNDDRQQITLNHLLRMESGLAWDEDYAAISDVTKMLFLESDMTSVQARQEAIAQPSEVWNYSSGTTNLLSGILRKQFATHEQYLNFPYAALIDKIGMHSMLIEADMEGNYVGSSYGWASTTDWAKFGLLYLHRGNWNGTQLFAPEWVDYVTTPTLDSDGVYGAHFWLNSGGKYPDAPRDVFSANGFQGQRVFIVPSKDLIVVRTGLANESIFDSNALLRDVIAAIK